MSNLEKIVNELSTLTVLEAAELSKMLEEKWGVTAAVPMAAASAPTAGSAESVTEKTEFDIILTAVGDKKLEVIRVVKEITGLGLQESKSLVDNVPKLIKEGLTKEKVDEIKEKLEAAGAKVEIK